MYQIGQKVRDKETGIILLIRDKNTGPMSGKTIYSFASSKFNLYEEELEEIGFNEIFNDLQEER